MLSGTVPAALSSITSLVYVDSLCAEHWHLDMLLQMCSSSTLLALQKRSALDLGGNTFSMDVFDSLTTISSTNGVHLRQLYLDGNPLFGSIPPTIAGLFPMTMGYLKLSNSLLNGTIPESISQLSWLEYVDSMGPQCDEWDLPHWGCLAVCESERYC
jgi:hypothetical protein